MTDPEKTAIEAELALREKLLAFKKKQQELNREAWQRTGLFLGIGFILLLCSVVVVFGGYGIYKISEHGIKQETRKSCVASHSPNKQQQGNINTPKSKSGLMAHNVRIESKEEKGRVEWSVKATSHDTSCTKSPEAFPSQPESTLCPHSWSSNIMLTINGILVLAGLGVATFLGSRLLGERE